MRGKKCPMRHTRHVGPTTELPFTSAHQTADGGCELHVRPPLKGGLDMYFSEWHGDKETGVGGRQRVSNSLELIELPHHDYQVNVHRLSALSRFDFAHGVDGSILEDGDLVYVVNHGILSIDYFHGQIPGHGPVAQMMDKGESDIFAYEMFSLRRSSSIVRAMTRLQRIWRRRRQQRVPVSIATNSSASNGAK